MDIGHGAMRLLSSPPPPPADP